LTQVPPGVQAPAGQLSPSIAAQVTPSPSKPVRHWQTIPKAELTQAAFTSQPSKAHSSSSSQDSLPSPTCPGRHEHSGSPATIAQLATSWRQPARLHLSTHFVPSTHSYPYRHSQNAPSLPMAHWAFSPQPSATQPGSTSPSSRPASFSSEPSAMRSSSGT
jgi:hypothetical protein